MPRALGRRPSDPYKPALRLGNFLLAVPDHPIAVDDTVDVTYAMDKNDQFGVCVPTGFDNLRRTVTKLLTGKEVNASWADIVSWYRSQNPDFNEQTGENDEGMVIQDFLSWLVKQKMILGFAKVDVKNDEELQAAVYLGLGILWGVDLQTAQQAQTDNGIWDYRHSSEWGGHCVVSVAYESNDQQDVITWAERVRTTDSFRRYQLEEAWMVILPEHAQHPDFRAGFDLEKFAQAYTAITGRAFPATSPTPAPSPTPQPTPTPGAASFPGADAAVDHHIVAAASRAHLSPTDWLNRHFRSYFHL